MTQTSGGRTKLLEALGVDITAKREMLLDQRWLCYSLNHNGPTKDIPVILIESGPKNVAEIKKTLKNLDAYAVLFGERHALILKVPGKSHTAVLESEAEYERVSSILESCNISSDDEFDMQIGLTKAVDAIPHASTDFDSHGPFSTHYLHNRIFDDLRRNIDDDVKRVRPKIGGRTGEILDALGWSVSGAGGVYHKRNVSIVVTDQDDFSIRQRDSDVAPSYTAVAELGRKNEWVILTNGKKWRLYTNRISASSTNYLDMTLGPGRDSALRYLVALFGAASYRKTGGLRDIDIFFDESGKYARDLEEDLSAKIMSADGLFLDIVKGVLDHDMKKKFDANVLEEAKQASLRILYRIWFLTHAESRNLLPTRDERYSPVSLRAIHSGLDAYEDDPDGCGCWKGLLNLFVGIRDGSEKYNIPQYNGGLFSHTRAIDGLKIRNRFIVGALRGILEKDGEPVDYASLGVRHLGNVFESLMEFSVRQAERNIMLVDDGDGVREVKTRQESAYSYKKNSLYLASKGGIASRKTSASYYTPDGIVRFLVGRGLEPILDERRSLIADDLKRYHENESDANRQACMDRLLDIQVLDPAMGSGHFLVEALNRITSWATDMLKVHPDHPLLKEIEADRRAAISEQRKKHITIDESLLTPDVLLKRKIMKRCIFGVDINPLAVELAKMSLWLDSFAIGVPFTYLDHHIKTGDSTMGVWFSDLKDSANHTLDDWIEYPEGPSRLIGEIGHSSDITVDQVRDSRVRYGEYVKQTRQHKAMLDTLAMQKIDKKIIPKNAQRDIPLYLRRIADAVSGKTKRPDDIIKKTISDIRAKSDDYKFFHWELEMMDAFTDKRRGFDLITGNPPWDKVRAMTDEFFTSLDPDYKNKSANEKEKIRKKYDKEFQKYKNKFDEKKQFYRKYGGIGENMDFDLYRIVTERVLRLLAPNGVFSMLVPSAITNSRGAAALRKHFLSRNILSLYVLENSKKIFPIHSGYRFALLSVRNADGPDTFPAGFYLHTMNELENPGEHLLHISKKRVGEMSPKMSIIYEIRSPEDFQITEKLVSNHPRLEDVASWSVDLGRELDMTGKKDKTLLVKRGGWPVLESKNFHQHVHNYSTPKYHVDIRKTLERIRTIAKFHGQSKEIHENPQLVYRRISSSINTRTMIACINPPSVFTTNATFMALPRIGMFTINSDYHRLGAYLCGIFNSTTYDYLIRQKVDKSVETYLIYDTPVPEDFTSDVAKRISKLSSILALSDSWHDGMADAFPIDRPEVQDITLGKRIELTAEIDALSALHYGLTRGEYEHILKSFKFSKTPFTGGELSRRTDYRKMHKPDRDRHMRMFYGQVYGRALDFYDRLAEEYGTPGTRE